MCERWADQALQTTCGPLLLDALLLLPLLVLLSLLLLLLPLLLLRLLMHWLLLLLRLPVWVTKGTAAAAAPAAPKGW